MEMSQENIEKLKQVETVTNNTNIFGIEIDTNALAFIAGSIITVALTTVLGNIMSDYENHEETIIDQEDE